MPKTNIVVKDFGLDGNAFALMGQVTRALKKGGHADLVDAFRKEATSGNYDHLLATCMEYVEIEYVDPNDSMDEEDEEPERPSPVAAPSFQAKLDALFTTLEGAGYFARQNWEDCQSCGWAAIPEDKADKAVFYHEQDAEDLPRGLVYLAWAGDGNEIKRLAEVAGLIVEWDGSENTRIVVKEG